MALTVVWTCCILMNMQFKSMLVLKGHNTQHIGHMGQISQAEKH